MASSITSPVATPAVADPEAGHRLRWRIAAGCGLALVVALFVYGSPYYLASVAERTRDPLHQQLRPSGTIGLKLGMLAGGLFLMIYLYPLRKRLSWMRGLGKTRRWLDFHILLGLLAPVLITMHSSFKFQGVAGMAFWIMWAVAMSGIVGRYFYSQIPRSLSAAELTLKEIEDSRSELNERLQGQQLVDPDEIERICALPEADEVQEMSLGRALFTMARIDLLRPFAIGRLRRRAMSPARMALSLGGLLPWGSPEFEQTMSLVRKRAWLSTKIAFLAKTQRVFHLWHVVHRPFSYSFAVLVIVHIGFVIMMGYF